MDGGRPPPAAGLPMDGGRACASAHGDSEAPFRSVRTAMALLLPSWTPSWSLPPPMRAAAPDPHTGDAAPAPSECLSEAHYRLLRHAAVQHCRFFWVI